ncbi:hypothetical protein EMCG_07718 [[Emmonsia] crescens]|uniref:Uncharacterized protein n=1 Tax=[Emmonsia] crescens TaxID=73230 RepID=A0A0G2J5B8_9EURO|nr:hypothetical protein EMCG_07718 [Emmonsia crescens UAMH 3008]
MELDSLFPPLSSGTHAFDTGQTAPRRDEAGGHFDMGGGCNRSNIVAQELAVAGHGQPQGRAILLRWKRSYQGHGRPSDEEPPWIGWREIPETEWVPAILKELESERGSA